MNIKEVEQLLSVSRANIRFYEKEGLIAPKRKENNYRDYSEADVDALRRVLVFRKLGFSVEEILRLQQGELLLPDAAQSNILRLEKTIEELQGSLEMTKKMAAEGLPFAHIDHNRYWNEINSAEQAGIPFMDICKDYLLFELDLFDHVWRTSFFHDFKGSRMKYGVPIACGLLLLICVIRGLAKKFLWDGNFWEGFLYPFLIFAIVSVVLLPLHILGKKSPKAAQTISKFLTYGCLAVLLAAVAAFVLLFLKNAFGV